MDLIIINKERLAHYLHIKNENAHRAYDDAYVCGQILNHIVKGSFQ